MVKAIAEAIVILNRAAGECEKYFQWGPATKLTHAIRHLARPERDVYPKTRQGTKSDPVILPKRPKHSCPYQVDINGNDDPEYCDCDEVAEGECRDDI